MRKLFLIVTILFGLVSSNLFAQIENIPVTKDVTINKLYAGTLGWSNFNIDSLHASNAAVLRFGAVATWRPNDWFALRSLNAFNVETGNGSWSMNQFSAIINPTKKLTVTVGNMCTLVTEQRPSPASAGGQFETWTQSKIPGMALCAKASLAITDKLSAGLGIAGRNSKPEYQANISLGKTTLSAFYDEWNKKYGSVLTFAVWRVSEVVVWQQDNIIANLLNLELGPDKDYCVYSDMGWDLDQHKLVRGEWGVLKTFSGKYIKGLIGPGYCYEDRSVHAYLFVHL
ncbi:MAG: hypothetical protein NTX66_03015 [Candidatus Falkowbacteria bacterium]|nr:hypothetical protein [Candidatus Falkowbacteria bacterium]